MSHGAASVLISIAPLGAVSHATIRKHADATGTSPRAIPNGGANPNPNRSGPSGTTHA
jgi:hypothetical protein